MQPEPVLAGALEREGEPSAQRRNAPCELAAHDSPLAAFLTFASEGKKGARGDNADSASGYDRRVDVVIEGSSRAMNGVPAHALR